ncbi:MAG: hypothetical protein OXC46_10310, partial [Thaumarchaeota archaeon]|nr:hypothetical protein [Nitrososphaerota archaeon]
MNYYILTETSEITNAHSTMYDNLEKYVTKNDKTVLGAPTESNQPFQCSYNKKVDMWWHRSPEVPDDSHYWNPFGIGEPDWGEDGNTNMLLQINFKKKYNRRPNGAFVRDDTGKVFVAHNGRSGGLRIKNRVKIPKNHRIIHVSADDGHKDLRELFLISEINSSRLARNIKEYLEFVKNPSPELEPHQKPENQSEPDEYPFFEEDVKSKNMTPKRKKEIREITVRNTKAVKKLKKLYNNKCQISGTKYTFKKKDNGEYYSEAHHLIPLGENGADNVSNIVI